MISTSNNRVLITNFKLIEMCIKSSPKGGRTNWRVWVWNVDSLLFTLHILHFPLPISHFPLSFMSFLAACGPYVFVPRWLKNMSLCLYVKKLQWEKHVLMSLCRKPCLKMLCFCKYSIPNFNTFEKWHLAFKSTFYRFRIGPNGL